MRTPLHSRSTLVLLAAAALSTGADAAELRFTTAVDFESAAKPSASLSEVGGGTCQTPTCVALQTGLDSGAGTYVVFYEGSGGAPQTSTQYTGLAGGTVTYGHLSGTATGTIRTTHGQGDQYFVDLIAGFTDEVTIMPADPALLGTPGLLTASLHMEQHLAATAIASATTPGELFAATAQWVLQGPGGNLASAQVSDTDDESPSTSFSVIGSQSVVTIPTTFIVPYQASFTFGEPFDLWMQLMVDLQGGGPSSPQDEEVWNADSGMNFLHTIAWQGISAVEDVGGNTVAFSLEAVSGTDWTQAIAAPVPVPAALWSMLTAVGGLWVGRRRTVTCERGSAGA